MFRKLIIATFVLSLCDLANSVTICSSSSLLSTFTDPLCTSWCKVRVSGAYNTKQKNSKPSFQFCSSGSCRSVMSGSDPTCECESCGFGSWFGSSSDSNSNQPVSGQYYAGGSGGEMATPNYGNNNGYNNGYNNGNNMRYNDNNGYNTNNGYRGQPTPGYGNSNSNFNSNQQYSYQQYYNNRNNQYGNSGYGNAGQAGQTGYPSGYQNLKKKR